MEPVSHFADIKKKWRRKRKRMSLLMRNLIRTNNKALQGIDLSAIVLF
jgi:hypothetical protein